MNFSEMWNTWVKVLTSPGEATFDDERRKPNATATTALIWMVIAGVVAAVLGLIQSMAFAGAAQGAIPQLLAQLNLPLETQAQLEAALRSGAAGSFGAAGLGSIISVPLGFFIGTGILFLIGKLFGGQGDFGRYSYLMAAFNAPLTILSAILNLIPVVGCLSIFIAVYEIVLAYYATKVEQQLTSGRALLTVLLPVIIGLLLAICFGVAVLGLVAGLMQNSQ